MSDGHQSNESSTVEVTYVARVDNHGVLERGVICENVATIGDVDPLLAYRLSDQLKCLEQQPLLKTN